MLLDGQFFCSKSSKICIDRSSLLSNLLFSFGKILKLWNVGFFCVYLKSILTKTSLCATFVPISCMFACVLNSGKMKIPSIKRCRCNPTAVCIFHGFLLNFHLKFGILLGIQSTFGPVTTQITRSTCCIHNGNDCHSKSIKHQIRQPLSSRTAENLIDIVGVLRIHNRIVCGYAALASIIMYAGFWHRFRGQMVHRGFGKHRNRWQNKKNNRNLLNDLILLCLDAFTSFTHLHTHVSPCLCERVSEWASEKREWKSERTTHNRLYVVSLYCGWLSTFDIAIQLGPCKTTTVLWGCYCLDSLLIAKTTRLECSISIADWNVQFGNMLVAHFITFVANFSFCFLYALILIGWA